MPVSLQVVKLKINGRCMNACRFCKFHERNERLEQEDVLRVLASLPSEWRGQVLINGGEPTLHPRFGAISRALAAAAPDLRRGVGTNLRLFERKGSRVRGIWQEILNCYQLVQVGCDDEHRNVDVVERKVPELRAAGLEVYLNVVEPFCSPSTRERLLALDAATGSKTRFSPVTDHTQFQRGTPTPGDEWLCDKRQRELLVDCNGDVFFCFRQDFAEPVINLRSIDDAQLRHFLASPQVTKPYRACPSCARWTADRAEDKCSSEPA